MLKEKKGVLATRSPHRPNPVGVTLARVERVDKKTRTVHLSACDLVQGTPVLDMKPYVPNYDTVEPCKIPQWILETIDTRNTVIFAPEALESARSKQLSSKLKQYRNQPDLYLQGS
jgi:tRNA (adenine37-N6)-methyltransferase